jgi:hypothetical protein
MPKRETTMKAKVWEERYSAAVLETDDEKLPKRIQAAKASIDARIHELHSDHGGTPAERHAICDALAKLNVLRRELESRSESALALRTMRHQRRHAQEEGAEEGEEG